MVRKTLTPYQRKQANGKYTQKEIMHHMLLADQELGHEDLVNEIKPFGMVQMVHLLEWSKRRILRTSSAVLDAELLEVPFRMEQDRESHFVRQAAGVLQY